MKRLIYLGMILAMGCSCPILAISSNYALLQAAREKVKAGDHEKAALLYKKAIQLDEADALARAELSALIVEDSTRNWHAESIDSVETLVSSGETVVEGGGDLSLQQLRNIVLQEPDFPWQKEAMLTLQKIHLKDSSAFLLASKLQEKHPNHVVAYNLLGLAYQMQGEFQSAEKTFQKALTLDPNFISARLNLAELYLQIRETQLAETELNQVLASNPHHRQACLLMGQLALSDSNPELAQLWYSRAGEDL